MRKEIKEIWIESEEKGPIINSIHEQDDNSDVIVTFGDGTRYLATFFTYLNIEQLRQKNKKTGESLNGRFFWASDMLIVEKVDRQEIEAIINHLITEEAFELIFRKIK